jgi:hypothetical protein
LAEAAEDVVSNCNKNKRLLVQPTFCVSPLWVSLSHSNVLSVALTLMALHDGGKFKLDTKM